MWILDTLPESAMLASVPVTLVDGAVSLTSTLVHGLLPDGPLACILHN